ncbi:UvrD-helicase domain-containing protein [Halogeometricum sp. S1BR25-6]|uniref:DNA 3'-5' helicase n=1 Tax=Halogeometricum salsisoli TaxID=2950536 RepID=A0ABU2GJA0_9EURY|nr:UvrD-helicase domain-containing protein [Halogeometricum sp. S1BR25-6]MDS0300911.1 UvrD-helicase domain-containing protein [Halogeometricum sp. S1BR25-6]
MVDFNDLTTQQQQAATALERNLSLTAGAGTGKTTTLTQRYIKMLERGIEEDPDEPITPTEILVTTFTRRAANELQKSVREEITAKLETDSEFYDQWLDIANSLEEGYINTLHGICSRFLREHALSVDSIDPGFETLDEGETARLIEEVTARTLADLDRERHDGIQELTPYYSRRELQSIFADLLSKRPESTEWATWMSEVDKETYLEAIRQELHPLGAEEVAEILFDDGFAHAVDQLQSLHAAQPSVAETSDKGWSTLTDLLRRLEAAGYPNKSAPLAEKQELIQLICDDFTGYKGDLLADSNFEGSDSNWTGLDAERERFQEAMNTIVEQIDPEENLLRSSIEIDELAYPLVSALATTYLEVADTYRAEKRARNVVDYTDQVQFTIDFLESPDHQEARKRLCDQFEFVMVDEFQDTDPRQWDLIRLLTSTDSTDFDAQNVFVVGDEKQSIYRFRNADVTQFGEITTLLETINSKNLATTSESNADDQLSQNFRTLQNSLSFINDLFDEVFEEAGPEYEASPQPLDAKREDPEQLDSLVEYLVVPTDESLRADLFEPGHPLRDAQPEHDADLEAEALASRLTTLFESGQQVYEPEGTAEYDKGDVRLVEPSDVAILLRTRTHLKRFERALDRYDIPYTVSSGIGFYDTPEITALYNLLQILANPSDSIALYGVLRSPLFGFTDSELAALAEPKTTLWSQLQSSTEPEFVTARSLIQSWRSAAGVDGDGPTVDSWSQLLTQIIDDTGYLISISAGDRPQQAVANVEKFRDQLRSWSTDGSASLTTLVSEIQERREQDDKEGEGEITGEAEGVQILTVHDAKGDEFPVVAVPGLDREFMDKATIANGKIEFETINGTPGIGIKGPDPDERYDTQWTIAREGLARQRRAEERAEEKRTLYVAMTRARDHLLLSSVHSLDSNVEPNAGLAGLETVGDRDPKSWREFVQPVLFDGLDLSELTVGNPIIESLKKSTYRLSLPDQPARDWKTDRPQLELTYEIEVTDPVERPLSFKLTPSGLADVFDPAIDGTFEVDESRRVVTFDRPEDPRDRGDISSSSRAEVSEDDLDGATFGEIVHRLCELRPPVSQRDTVAQNIAEEERPGLTLDEQQREQVRRHADRGIAYVDELTTEYDVIHQYSELPFTLTLADDLGTIVGIIDRVLVTPDSYIVVDYKTDSVNGDQLRKKAEHYETQIRAYALALHQQDPSRYVDGRLYFTGAETEWMIEWSPSELATGLDDLQTDLEGILSEIQP